jgi:hypothetical protein
MTFALEIEEEPENPANLIELYVIVIETDGIRRMYSRTFTEFKNADEAAVMLSAERGQHCRIAMIMYPNHKG